MSDLPSSLLRPRRGGDFLAVLALTVLVFALYWPALDGGIIWDDPAHLTREGLRGWDGLRRIWFEFGATQEYYPVLHSAFWFEHRLWGDATTPYHVLNVVLHLANCVLLAVLLRRIWRLQPESAGKSGGAAPLPAGAEWLAAALLAVHPVAVESVAWITEQKNTLSTALYLLAAICYLDFSARRTRISAAGTLAGIDGGSELARSPESGPRASRGSVTSPMRSAQAPTLQANPRASAQSGGTPIGSRRWVSYILALGLFAAAVGTKTMTVTLPAALLVVQGWRHGRLEWGRDFRPLLPWFAVALAAGFVTVWFEGNWVGASEVADDLAWTHRALLAARILWFSLGKLIWPTNLTFFYPRWEVAVEAAGWVPYLVGGAAVTALLWWHRRRARGPLAAWLLYTGTLFPVLGFFNIFSFSFSYVADHYQYLAMPVFCATVAIGVTGALAPVPTLARRAAWIFLGLVVLGLGFLAHWQSRLYGNDTTLFRANIAANPRSWMAHHILGTLAAKSPDRREEAIALYRQALQLKPRNPDSLAALAALLAEEPGHRDEVIANFQEALRLRPNFAEAHNGLANELADLPGRLSEAIEHYRAALRLRPLFALARANLAQALARLPGHETEALGCFAEVLQVMPDYVPAHYHLANLLVTLPGRESEALAHYEYVLGRRPDSAETHTRLGDLLIRLGRKPEALAQYETALELNPRLAAVHYAMATHLVEIPSLAAEALEHARVAVSLEPDNVEAQNLLGVIHARQGRPDEARACWNRALQLKPDFGPALRNLQLLDRGGR
ncbi:MAG TPA: tetratricopeptide repeat protein [Lacunisphaera sp.]|nr:tetratricopeptide repeat protein [Lacunisphaera sp.]